MIGLLLAQTIAITGATVYPVSGPKIAHATVLIRDGKITAVGARVVIPARATRIDATDKWVTPGLLDGSGQMGLVEIDAVAATRDAEVRKRHGGGGVQRGRRDQSRLHLIPLRASKA